MYGGQRDWLTFWEVCQFRTYHWKVVVPGTYPFDMSRVHPWQQQYVANVYKAVKDISTLNSLILFGSSITPFCNMRSDLDLAFEGDLEAAYLPVVESCPNGVDLIELPIQSNERLKLNIEKGLRII